MKLRNESDSFALLPLLKNVDFFLERKVNDATLLKIISLSIYDAA